MAKAKGILPLGADRSVLYKSPRACGYFIGVTLDPALDRAGITPLVENISALVDALVARATAADKADASSAGGSADAGDKVAAVAVGFAPTFFMTNGQPRFEGLESPAAFDGKKPLPSVAPPSQGPQTIEADLMLYVVSTYEARVNAFVADLDALAGVQRITLDRGFQRMDGTEPFGYADGLRNVDKKDRERIVFVDRDGLQPEEPHWADGGSYMAYMKILQRPEKMAALPDDAARDAVIGREKDGTRLDLAAEKIKPRDEPADRPPSALPPGAHVAKAGPRGPHDDNEIFRRGLPFMETTADGQLRVGLNFCSFQGSLEQFDVVLNDWMMNPHFPVDGPVDALFDDTKQLTQIEKVGFYFVPPYEAAGLAAAVFKEAPKHKPTTGRLVVKKRVTAAGDAAHHFDRRGFVFQILDENNQPVPNATFTTDTAGRGICPVELEIGKNYVAQETQSTVVQNVQLTSKQFTMEKQNFELSVENVVIQPDTPYGAVG